MYCFNIRNTHIKNKFNRLAATRAAIVCVTNFIEEPMWPQEYLPNATLPFDHLSQWGLARRVPLDARARISISYISRALCTPRIFLCTNVAYVYVRIYVKNNIIFINGHG